MQTKSLYAAVDLGSNSFRLEIGHFDSGQMRRVAYLKETVRQGNGLDSDRNLTPEAMHRGWDCLARFAERIAGFRKPHVRAVATQTLREARNRDVFLTRASEILGFPIEVISGREEARLIYQGVAHLLPQSNERRLVIDIGGRSTEMILGTDLTARVMASYRVGSVAWSMKYFQDGQLTATSFERAEIAAKAILDEALSSYPPHSWDMAYGSSGTVGAVADVLSSAGWPSGKITTEGIDWLKRCLVRAQHISKIRIEGLKEDRKSVIAGGLSVLQAVMDLLGIQTLQVAQGALRHGVLFDMVDRESFKDDARLQTVARLQANFNVDTRQSQRVSSLAQQLLRQLTPDHEAQERDRLLRKLDWAAQLHEVGIQISHSDYHKHGAYILDNVDVTGFAQPELHRLSLLVLGHHGKLRKLEVDFDDEDFAFQLICLRISVILCHARRDPDADDLSISLPRKQNRTFVLSVTDQWCERFPQSAHLLREETVAWQKTSWALELQIQ
jgi:exopolyphosphatase/guanosine-5'-triphosphate,3'-diphosphate pyrophosphatase